MPRVSYIKTTFIEPKQIDKATYDFLKQKILHNSNYIIDTDTETFWQYFSDYLRIMKICGIVGGIGLLCGIFFAKKNNWADVIASVLFVISFFVFISVIIKLALEGPSFSTYSKKRAEYFLRMKSTIQESNSYTEFVFQFYKIIN